LPVSHDELKRRMDAYKRKAARNPSARVMLQFIWTHEVSKADIVAHFNGHNQQEAVILAADGIELLHLGKQVENSKLNTF
jgi:hypothetical protein